MHSLAYLQCWCLVNVFLLQSLQCEYRRSNMRPWPCAEVRGGFYVLISMSIMHEQPRRTWPQNVPYLHLTGVDTEGGVVGPLRLWLREEGDIDLKTAFLSRVAAARGRCRCLSHPMSKHNTATLFGNNSPERLAKSFTRV